MMLNFLIKMLFLYNEVYLGIIDFEFDEIENKPLLVSFNNNN